MIFQDGPLVMSGTVEIEIRRSDKGATRHRLDCGIYTIGSDYECKIRLGHKDVDPRHAVLTIGEDSFRIEDLGTRTGTRLAGLPVYGHAYVKAGQAIGIGPFEILIEPNKAAAVQTAPATADSQRAGPGPARPEPATREVAEAAPESKASLALTAAQERAIRQQIHKELVERLNIKRLSVARINQQELRNTALKTIRSIVAEVSDRLPAGMEREVLVTDVYNEAVGLGPLEGFLADPEITEIMVNGPNQVYVEKHGKLELTDKTFLDDGSVLAIIERIVSPIGRRIDESQPYVDARLPDGSRVNAIIHPLSLIGPCLTIRKFSQTPFTDKDLMRLGTMTVEMAELLRVSVLLRKNLVVSGGTGSGKTTLLNVLSSYLPSGDRIITIEDAAELRLNQTHVVRLEARPPNIEGKGAITIRDLVRNALRMRPDRIVVGECRGGEALDMLQAMNTGHDGSLTTVHANSPRDVISRLETMVLMSGMELPVRAIREQIASAIDLIVHTARYSDGTRKIARITEIVGLEGDQITMQDIFEFRQSGVGHGGKVLGSFAPTGAVPTFIEEVHSRGLSIDRTIFDPLKNTSQA